MLRNRHRLHKSITMQFNGNAPLKKSTVKSNKYQVFSNKFGDVYHIYPRDLHILLFAFKIATSLFRINIFHLLCHFRFFQFIAGVISEFLYHIRYFCTHIGLPLTKKTAFYSFWLSHASMYHSLLFFLKSQYRRQHTRIRKYFIYIKFDSFIVYLL